MCAPQAKDYIEAQGGNISANTLYVLDIGGTHFAFSRVINRFADERCPGQAS